MGFRVLGLGSKAFLRSLRPLIKDLKWLLEAIGGAVRLNGSVCGVYGA